MNPGKLIHVSCAIIEKEGLVLVTRRGPQMSHPGKWEFPGGKLNSGETPEQCLVREIQEELALGIEITRQLRPSTHDYPNLSVTLYPFICTITGGEILLHEHSAFAWLTPSQLATLDWAEADIPVLHHYLAQR